MRKKRTPRSLFLILSLVCLTALAPATHARELKVGLTSAPGQIWVVACKILAERLKEETDGELTLAVFPSSQLGRDSEMLQQLEVGVLDMHLGALRSLTTREPALTAWFTPYLIPDQDTAEKAADTPAAKKMLRRLERFGMVGLAYTFGGYRHVLMQDKPFTKPADLADKKIRISNFPAARTWYKALGAAPVPVPLGETYHALQLGIIDGIDIDLDALVNLEFHRIAKHLTITSHMIYPGVFLMSRIVWDSLSPSHQEILARLVREAAAWSIQQQIQADRENLKQLESEIDVHHLEQPEVILKQAISAWHEEYGDRPLVRKFQEQVERLGRHPGDN